MTQEPTRTGPRRASRRGARNDLPRSESDRVHSPDPPPRSRENREPVERRLVDRSRRLYTDTRSSPNRTMVFTTRPINCRTDPSRWGRPGFPWNNLLVTMFVASVTSSWAPNVFLAEDRHGPSRFQSAPCASPFDRVERGLLAVGKVPLEAQTFFPRHAHASLQPCPWLGIPASNACFTVPSVPALRSHSRGRTLSFYSSGRPAEVPPLRFRSGLKLTPFDFHRVVKAGSEKKKPTAVRSHLNSSAKRQRLAAGRLLRTQPNSRCSASNTGAGQVIALDFFA